ncbi:hypothetical protein BDB01DRAFT_794559 [Pilobolus umbonatus]|nr:hypothetical protein BDB01DRAFT_794559 [Pilobolus umbonatus]
MLFYAFRALPDCDNSDYINTVYLPRNETYDDCLLDRQKYIASDIYFSMAIINMVATIAATAFFVYLAKLGRQKHPLDMSSIRSKKSLGIFKRSLPATCLSVLGYLILTTFILIAQTSHGMVACQLTFWGYLIGMYTWMYALGIRAYCLWFRYRANQLAVKFLRISVQERISYRYDPDYIWYTSHQNKMYVELPMPFLLYVIILLAILSVALPIHLVSAKTVQYCDYRWASGVLVALYVIFLGGLAPAIFWYLRNVSDAHGIRKELWTDIILSTPFFILYIIETLRLKTNESLNNLYERTSFTPGIYIVVFLFICNTLSIVGPIVEYATSGNCSISKLMDRINHSIKKRKSVLRNNQLEYSVPCLEKVLHDPHGINELQELAIKDFSSENILFYQTYLELEESVKMYMMSNKIPLDIPRHLFSIYGIKKKLPTFEIDNCSNDRVLSYTIPHKLLPSFVEFYENYIREGSTCQVNISHRAREKLDDTFNRIYHNSSNSKRREQNEHHGLPFRRQDKACCDEKESNEANDDIYLDLSLKMFEQARIEVFWNIFNSVFPKLVENDQSSS